MASDSAWSLGAEIASKNIAARRERKEALGDEERRLRVADYYNRANSLAKLIPSLTGDDRTKAMGQLTDLESAIASTYHPQKSPGVLERDRDWLIDHIFRHPPPHATWAAPSAAVLPAAATTFQAATPGVPSASISDLPRTTFQQGAPGVTVGSQQIALPPALAVTGAETATPPRTTTPKPAAPAKPAPRWQQRMEREQQQRRAAAQKQAQLDVAAAGLTPEQTIADVENKLNRISRLPGLQMTSDQKETLRQSMIYSALGVKEPPSKYSPQIQTTKDDQGKEHYWRMNLNTGEMEEVGEFGGQTLEKKGGAGAKGLRFDKTTGQVLDPISGKRYDESDPANPPEVQAMFTGFHRLQNDQRNFQTRLQQERAKSWNASKPIASLDTWNDNAPTEVPFSAYAENPGRYAPANAGAKALAATNTFEELGRVSRQTRDAINGLKQDFPADMKAKVAVALATDHPESAIQSLLSSGALGALTDDQRAFMISVQSLTENAMAMRQVLGAGQGSDQVRRAIEATLPTLMSPDRAYALAQLDSFDKTLEQLHKGVQKMPLSSTPWTVQGGGGPQAGAATIQRTDTGVQKTKGLRDTMDALRKAGQPASEEDAKRFLFKNGYGYTLP